ncbi:hypothetical protein [Nocardioides cavernaquae]|uniref:Uncharacterized protein n=1 Tax=Nocardioides cavernaquae TaxID=2321396 RepID=A0A3A5HE33_9ACTN|nr:hypothetical protein [Nocardioides cavernaquae]RJS46304.1 hypothetical protein D4739_08810 [Nocardioides cavernaquae]
MGVLLAGSTGCGQAGSTTSTVDRLRALPGVRDAAVERIALDDDYFGYQAAVDMEPDAQPPQIAIALDELARWKQTHEGDETSTAVYLDGGTTDLDQETWGEGSDGGGPTAVLATAGSHARNLANAELLVAATAALDLPVTIRDGEWRVTSRAPRATAAVIAAHPDLASSPDLIISPRIPLGEERWGRPAGFGSSRLTPELVATYDTAVANAELVREGEVSVSFVGNTSTAGLGETFDEVTGEKIEPPVGAVDIMIDLRLPGGAGPRSLAPRLVDDARWPMIRAQLDLLRTLPRGSHVWIWLQWTPRGGIAYDATRTVIEVTLGEELVGQARTPWNLQAQQYLAR